MQKNANKHIKKVQIRPWDSSRRRRKPFVQDSPVCDEINELQQPNRCQEPGLPQMLQAKQQQELDLRPARPGPAPPDKPGRPALAIGHAPTAP